MSLPCQNVPSSAEIVDLPRTMAPGTEKGQKTLKVLVANKKVMETEKAWNKLEYRLSKGADGVYFIDDEDGYEDVLHSMASICKKPISRLYYIDSDNDEVPIDGEVEYKEALKLIGERTDKGKFTTMKIETDHSNKSAKKKAKKAKLKAMMSETNVASDSKKLLKAIPKKAAHDFKTYRDILPDDTHPQKCDVSKAWLEKHLKQLKTELMADFKSFLEPYLEETMRMSAMLASRQLSQIDEKLSTSANMQQAESDHNYSANPRKAKRAMAHSKESTEAGGSVPQDDVNDPPFYALEGNTAAKLYQNGQNDEEPKYYNDDVERCNECLAQCHCQYDDDNLSIYSGEISVTESESEPDGASDDFVDVPLPACFNVIAPQGGACSSRTNPKGKWAKAARSENSASNQCLEPQQRSIAGQNAPENKKADMKESLRRSCSKQENSMPMQKNVEPVNFGQNTYEEEDNDNQISEKEEDEYDEVLADEDGQDYDDYEEDFDEDFVDDGKLEEEAGHKEETSSSAYQQIPLDLKQMSGQSPKREEYAPTTGCLPQKETYPAGRSTSRFPSPYEDIPAAPFGPKYPTPSKAISNSRLAPVGAPKMSLFTTQTRQGILNSQQPMLVLRGVPTQNSYNLESQQIQRPDLQPPCLPQQIQRPALQPPCLTQQPVAKLQQLTAASIIAQHQQIVQAAQRAARQAQQTQALCSIQPQTTTQTQQRAPASRNSPRRELVGSYQDENLSDATESPRGNAPQADHCTPLNITSSRSGSLPRQMQEAAQEVKMWNEVDKVDVELRKWVNMCQQLMELAPKRFEEADNSKKLTANAAKTYQDLEKVYRQFRKEVQLVSTQIDKQKQQKQQLQASGQPLSEDPIAILPEKLMQVISATLNTTFNLLGNISKLGVMNPQSPVPSEESKTAPASPVTPASSAPSTSSAMEKPQPQVSAAISPMTSAIGNMLSARAGYTTPSLPYTYYYPYISTLPSDSQNALASGIPTDTLGNQESDLAYRMRPMGATSSFASNYPFMWDHASAYTTIQPIGQTQTQTTMQVQSQSQQQQNQQQQSQQALQQLTQPQLRQLQQQVQPQLQQQVQRQLQQQQIQPTLQQQMQSQMQIPAPMLPQVQPPMSMQPQLQQQMQSLQMQPLFDNTLTRTVQPRPRYSYSFRRGIDQ